MKICCFLNINTFFAVTLDFLSWENALLFQASLQNALVKVWLCNIV